MFDHYLNKYQRMGSFQFTNSDSLEDVCNASVDASGIYLIYKIKNGIETLLYIGSSGQKKKDGTIKHRNGGLYDRLVNGYHPNRFGQTKRIRRNNAFPLQMKVEHIDKIIIKWWVTYDNESSDFPAVVEGLLKKEYKDNNNQQMPGWHK